MEFRILGPLEVVGTARVDLGGARERAVLARLLLSANQVVASERLIEDVWEGHPPGGASRALPVHISRLRKALRDGGIDEVLLTRSPGYVLHLEPGDLDAARFEALVAKGREQAADNPRDASFTLAEALALWRGPALADVADASFARAEAARLQEARLSAIEERMDADLACGRHAELIGELAALVDAHPLRERLWGQRILALYRAGRQAEALRAYQELRRHLAEELGIEPSSALSRLETAVLRHDEELDRGLPASPGFVRSAPSPLSEAPSLPLPLPIQAEGFFPVVGRASELARLGAAMTEALAGQRRLVLVGGEPGIGKTCLAAEAARRAHAGESTVLFGRCAEGMGVPYQPFVEALGAYVRQSAAPIVGRLGGELVRLMPEVAERVPGLTPPLRSDPETERFRLFDAVAAWLSAASEPSPVLLVLDDLHWGTRPTLQLLRHVMRFAEPLRLLVVATYRDTDPDLSGEVADAVAELLRLPGVERLALGGLDENGVAAFVQASARHALDAGDVALARVVAHETAGNPFFAGQVLRHLAETGAIVRREGRWVAGPLEGAIPADVGEVIRRRVAHLPGETGDLLTLAAVIGEHFELGVLVAATGEPEVAVLRALDPAVAARLLTEIPGPTPRYRFVHALAQATIYAGLPTARRMALHLQVAEAIETLQHLSPSTSQPRFHSQTGDVEEDVARLAHHLVACGPLGGRVRTARACLAAGDRALAVLADAEAREWYTRGLAVAEEDRGLHLDLLTGLGEAQRRTGDAATSRQTLLQAARLAVDHGDVTRAVRAVLANSRGTTSVIGHVDEERLELIATALDLVGPAPNAERAELLALQAAELVFTGDHHRVLRAADEAAAIAARLGDVNIRARVGVARLLACLVPDRTAAMASEDAEVVGFADVTADPQLRTVSRVFWVCALLAAGDLHEARRRGAEAVGIADEAGQSGLRCLARIAYAAAVDAQGDHDEAALLSQAALEFGQQAGWPDVMMWYSAQMWVRWIFEGNLETAAVVAAQGAATYPRMVAWHASSVLVSALAGRDEELAEFLAGLPAVLPGVPVDFIWLATHWLFAVALGFGVPDPEAASTLYELLLPYRSLHAAYGIGYYAPVETGLAVTARVRGDCEGALAHHEAAAVAIEACGAARARALNGYQWAVTLLGRNAPGDTKRAIEMAEETIAYCRTKGYLTFVTKTEELLARVR